MPSITLDLTLKLWRAMAMYKTEDFYKTFAGTLISFPACKRHVRKLTDMLGDMEGSSLDVNEGDWMNTGTGPCLICTTRRCLGMGLLQILYLHIEHQRTSIAGV